MDPIDLLITINDVGGDPIAILSTLTCFWHRPMSADCRRIIPSPRLSALTSTGAWRCQHDRLVRTATIFIVLPIVLTNIFLVKGCRGSGRINRRSAIEQNVIGDAPKRILIAVCVGPLPDNLIDEHIATEYCVHQCLQPSGLRVITVEIDAAVWFQYPPEFNEAFVHHIEIGFGARADGFAGGADYGCRSLALIDQPIQGQPLTRRQAVEVGELRAFSLRADRCGVIAATVERRVEVDEIDALAVEPLQDRQVFADEESAVLHVELGHSLPLSRRRLTQQYRCSQRGVRYPVAHE